MKEETLLLEFAYFGRLIKDKPNEVTQIPMEYLRVGWDDYNTDDICNPIQTALPPLQGVSSSTSQGKRKSRGNVLILFQRSSVIMLAILAVPEDSAKYYHRHYKLTQDR